MDPWAVGLLSSVIAAAVALAGALLMRRTTKEVEGAKTQAAENALLLQGFTDFVTQARADREADRGARIEAIRERDEAIRERDVARQERDAAIQALNDFRKQMGDQ